MSKKKIVEDTSITFPIMEFDALSINPHEVSIGEPQIRPTLTKTLVIKELDAYAEAASKVLSPGQLRTEAYKSKYEQALAIKNGDKSVDTSLVAQEAAIKKLDPNQLADAIINARDNMIKKINKLELIRIEYNKELLNTKDEDLMGLLTTYQSAIDECLK